MTELVEPTTDAKTEEEVVHATSDKNEANAVTAEVKYKTAAEKADAVSAFINTARLTGGRATFMAGFAYYSVGRYMFSCCESKSYFAFNIIALVLSIITAGTAQIFVYYAQRVVDPDLQYEFCIQSLSFNRALSRFGMLATFFYTIGIGLLPFAYYQESDMKWCPLILMIITALVYYPFMFKIVMSQLKLQAYQEPIFARIDDKEIVKNSIYGDPMRSEPLQDFLLKQSNVVSGRAIFISGLAQQGIMRFMPTPVEFRAQDHAANLFLVLVSLAMGFSYFSGNIFLLFQVFIPDTIKSKQLAFAIMIKPIANILFFCYISGFLALFLGNIFVADGCNFESLRRVSVIFGCIGLIMLITCIYQSAATDAAAANAIEKRLVKEQEIDPKSIDPVAVTSTPAPSDVDASRQLENIVSALNTAGAMSTFAAGYLFYNIITFDSDVLRLDGNSDRDGMVIFDLVANFTTVTFALYASVADTVLTLNANHYNTTQAKLKYFQSRMWIVQSVIYGYYFSLIGWFVCFACFGFVKYGRESYVPLFYASIGIVVMVIGTIYIHYARKSIDLNHPVIKSTKILTTEEVNVSISRPANLTSLGFSVIFLGGFAYFAVNFFDFNDREGEALYLHAMCVTFMTSMWVMVFGDRYNYQINKCPTITAKLSFAEKTFPFYCLTVALSYIVVMALLVGFNLLGNIKSISNYKEVRREIQMSTSIIAVFCFPLVYWVSKTFVITTYQNDLSIATPSKVFSSSSSTATSSQSEILRFKNQIIAGLTTSGFIAGNVCYELLFAEANGKDYQNKFYFFMMSFAFSFGVSAVVVSTLILLCLGELSTNQKKSYFVVTLRKAKLGIFVLSMGCVLSWQASILALSTVKYTGNKGGHLQSFIPGVFGLGSMLYYYFGVKKISDGILANGLTLTAPAVVASCSTSSTAAASASANSTSTAAIGNGDSGGGDVINPLVDEHGGDDEL